MTIGKLRRRPHIEHHDLVLGHELGRKLRLHIRHHRRRRRRVGFVVTVSRAGHEQPQRQQGQEADGDSKRISPEEKGCSHNFQSSGSLNHA